MLSEVLAAAAPTKRRTSGRPGGISISQLYPCPYRLYKVHTGTYWNDEITPQQYYNMDDGNTQENQSVERLAKAGIRIIDRQKRVTIGESSVPGMMDGAFTPNGDRMVWEHKAYDVDSDALWTLRNKGFDALPNQKSQLNGYMLGDGSTKGDFFVKIKNNNEYYDVVVKRDDNFILQIVEWCDRIRLKGWVPEPVECEWCTHCGLGCFGEILDFSWVATVSAEEVAEKWKLGDKHVKVGEMLKDEARAYFLGQKDRDDNVLVEGIIGDRDLLIVDGLEIKKAVQHRSDVKKAKVLEVFGAEGLIQVLEEKEITTYRFREIS